MIVLRPTELHWLNGSSDDPFDLCAHSGIDFRIGESILIRPSDGVWTASAAAVYLLRTLSRPHTKQTPIAEHLFPCCGNGMFTVDGEEDVLIIGCNSGIDFEVLHLADGVLVRTHRGVGYRVDWPEWRGAVREFSDAIWAFYEVAAPKQPADDEDRRGFSCFMAEWSRRRGLVETA